MYIYMYIYIIIYICMQLCIIYIMNQVDSELLCNTGPTAPCKLDSSRCVTIPLSDC